MLLLNIIEQRPSVLLASRVKYKSHTRLNTKAAPHPIAQAERKFLAIEYCQLVETASSGRREVRRVRVDGAVSTSLAN